MKKFAYEFVYLIYQTNRKTMATTKTIGDIKFTSKEIDLNTADSIALIRIAYRTLYPNAILNAMDVDDKKLVAIIKKHSSNVEIIKNKKSMGLMAKFN